MKTVYTVEFGSDGKFYASGPGHPGFQYHGGTLFPDMRFVRTKDAERAAAFANHGYDAGFKAAQKAMREALGLKP